jgi:hypothetical protein
MATMLAAQYIEARIAISWRSTFGITTLQVGIWKLRIIRGRLPRRCIALPYRLVPSKDATPRNDSRNNCFLKHYSAAITAVS